MAAPPVEVSLLEERVEEVTTALTTSLAKMAAARGNTDTAEKTLEGLKRKVVEAEAIRDEQATQKTVTVTEIVAACDRAIAAIRDIQQEMIAEVNAPPTPEKKDVPSNPPLISAPTPMGATAPPPSDDAPPPPPLSLIHI